MLFFCTCSASPLLVLLAMEKSRCLKVLFFSVPAIPWAVRRLQGSVSPPLAVEITSPLPCGNCLDTSPELKLTVSVRWAGMCVGSSQSRISSGAKPGSSGLGNPSWEPDPTSLSVGSVFMVQVLVIPCVPLKPGAPGLGRAPPLWIPDRGIQTVL